VGVVRRVGDGGGGDGGGRPVCPTERVRHQFRIFMVRSLFIATSIGNIVSDGGQTPTIDSCPALHSAWIVDGMIRAPAKRP